MKLQLKHVSQLAAFTISLQCLPFETGVSNFIDYKYF
jgi:hypothetical protein